MGSDTREKLDINPPLQPFTSIGKTKQFSSSSLKTDTHQ